MWECEPASEKKFLKCFREKAKSETPQFASLELLIYFNCFLFSRIWTKENYYILSYINKVNLKKIKPRTYNYLICLS